MHGVIKTLALAVLCSLVIALPSVWAYWATDGIAVCTPAINQYYPTIVSDGAGGAIITWYDLRNGNEDIFAQRVDASGTPLWGTSGVAICTAAQTQINQVIVSDGAGGAIIAWQDFRSGSSYDVYAQRVNSSGVVQWAANGVALCTAAYSQLSVAITTDGAGGAIVAWSDYRSGSTWDVYVQHVNASGGLMWPTNGVVACSTAGDQQYPQLVPDGMGGAIITWQDNRNVSTNYDIYAQRLAGLGGSNLWSIDGVVICNASGYQGYPTIASDGAGGAIITWYDGRTPANGFDIYAQRVNPSGLVQWPINGVLLCSASFDQYLPVITADGSGGAVIAWEDRRTYGTDYDIFAQKVNSSGAIQWPTNGVALSVMPNDQASPSIASDGGGGAIVTWTDYRSGAFDIYAQRVDAAGTAKWTANGTALCTMVNDQTYPIIVADGSGGAVVTWMDSRAGLNGVYAQCMDGRGRTGFLAPDIYSVRDVPQDQGGKVYLSWYGARADVFMSSEISYYSIWRAINPTKAAFEMDSGAVSLSDLSNLDRSSGKPVIREEQAAGRTFFWQLLGIVNAYYMPSYGQDEPTLFDSTSVGNEYTYFQVVAHSSDPKVFWKSTPDSGYSVDNLPPPTPRTVAETQSFNPVGIELKWTSCYAPDFYRYAVYRGTTADFVPGPSNLITSLYDTLYFDRGWRWDAGYYYKVSSLDIHGTESGFAVFAPGDVSGVETPKAPATSYLAQNYPNPFNPVTRIEFGLSVPASVSLRIYDAAGQLVRVLAEGTRPAGTYHELWDGKDSSGHAVASGIYFYRLRAGSFEQTRKMALMR